MKKREIKLTLKLPPPLYMVLAALLMWFLSSYYPIYEWESSFTAALGVVLIILGLGIDLYSLISFVKAKTSVNPFKPKNTTTLVTNGFYKVTRNPMYLGLLFVLIGWAFYLGSLISFFVLPVFIWILNTVQILPEEKILEEIYQDSYLRYKNKVRRWL